MNIKAILLTAVAATMLSVTGASADDWGHRDRDHHADRRDDRHDSRDEWRGHRDRDWRDDRGAWHGDHDRYWRPEFREGRYAEHDRFYVELRRHHYNRWIGDPYWYHGRYVIRTYDRYGRVVLVELNPYSGGFVGEIRF